MQAGDSFTATVQTDPGPQPVSTMGNGSFLGVKGVGRGIETPILIYRRG